MEANKILSADILDLVFEGRNKDYGAYQLRKTYNKRILKALIITASVALLALLGSFLASKLDTGPKKIDIKEVTIQDIKQDEEKPEPPPPPPPKPPDPPKIEMAKFTPPKIVKDEEVQEPPPEQKDLEKAKIDVQTQEGVKDEGIVTPVDLDQGKQIIEEKKDDNQIFEKVEVEAKFQGGDAGWKKYLERNLNANAPVDNGAPEGTYTVYVQFVVSKDGSISDVKALTNHGYGMEAEAIRVIKKGPNWTPAIQNGRSVNAYRKQPITFQVTSE
jgi:periplasmic protein TonB